MTTEKDKQYLTKRLEQIARGTTGEPVCLREAAYRNFLLNEMFSLNPSKAEIYQTELSKLQQVESSKQQRRWALGSTIFSGVMVLINGLVSATTTEKQPMVISGLSTTFAMTCFGGVMVYYAVKQVEAAIKEENTRPRPPEAIDRI